MSGTLSLPTTGTFSGLAEQGYINAALTALATMIQGGAAPTPASTGLASLAGVWWHDTVNSQIKVRDQADTAWIVVSQLDETAKAAVAAIPPGIVSPYAGAVAPSGWLLCDGSQVSRTTYATLFAAIGTTFGAGDGSSTFNVPDMRGRVPAGVDNMGGIAASRLGSGSAGGVTGSASLGAAGGEQFHILSQAEMPAHTHTYGPFAGSSATAGGASSTVQAGSNLTTSSTGGDAAHNNLQPTLVVTYIIKA